MARGLTPGELMSCYALIGYLTPPVLSLIGANRTVQDALVAADRLFEIMDLEREAPGDTMELTADLAGDIEFEHVGFRYGTREAVFTDLSLTIPRGHVTAIVGESGSGKSTLLALLQGLYPVGSGRIRIGGYDIRHVSAASLRRRVWSCLALTTHHVIERRYDGVWASKNCHALVFCRNSVARSSGISRGRFS